jgi:hypothetical protein
VQDRDRDFGHAIGDAATISNAPDGWQGRNGGEVPQVMSEIVVVGRTGAGRVHAAASSGVSVALENRAGAEGVVKPAHGSSPREFNPGRMISVSAQF